MIDTGFDAMGKPIPPERLSNALDAVRAMAPDITTEEAMLLIGSTANALEEDQPYEALKHAGAFLDLTGSYRLMATLLT